MKNNSFIKSIQKKRKENEEINTSALPDIIFMLLFYFMVVTVLKTQNPELQFDLPSAQQVDKISHKSYLSHIYIGEVEKDGSHSVSRIQFNDKFVDIGEIQKSIVTVTSQYVYADPNKVSFSLKIDKNIRMKLVDQLKNEIKKTDFRKVHYVAVN